MELTAADIAKRRKRFSRLHYYLPLPKSVKLEPVDTGKFKGEWLRVPGSRPNKVMLFFSGGGFLFSGMKIHRYATAIISKHAKVSTLSIDYRLAPEHPYPAALNDSVNAYEWLLKTGYKPQNIVLGGHSSGANLALATLLKIRAQKLPLPAAAFTISPPTDGRAQIDTELAAKDPMLKPASIIFCLNTYRGKTSVKNPYISPLFADLKGLPPLLMLVGEDELLFTESERFYKKAKAAGVNVRLDIGKQMWHGWPIYGSLLPEGKQALKTIAEFIDEQL